MVWVKGPHIWAAGPHGMVWYGLVWYGLVWYGMVWYVERRRLRPYLL